MARITESMGRLSVTVVCRAELPAAMSTTSSGPAPTASAETMAFPLSFPSSSRGRTTRSLMPWMLSSLRVETTVPTTRASCMVSSGLGCWDVGMLGGATFQHPNVPTSQLLGLLFPLRRRRRPAQRHHRVYLIVRARDHVHGDHVADSAGCRLRRVALRADR